MQTVLPGQHSSMIESTVGDQKVKALLHYGYGKKWIELSVVNNNRKK